MSGEEEKDEEPIQAPEGGEKDIATEEGEIAEGVETDSGEETPAGDSSTEGREVDAGEENAADDNGKSEGEEKESADAKVTGEKKAEVKPDENKPAWDEVARAKDLGFSEEEIESLSREDLVKASDLVERKMMQRFSSPAKPAEVKPEAEKPAAKVEAAPVGPIDIPDLDPKDWDEPMVKHSAAVKQAVGGLTAKVAEQQKFIDLMMQRENHREVLAAENEHDKWLDGLVEHKDTFGGKAGDVKDKKSGAWKARADMWKTVAALKQVYPQASLAAIRSKALNSMVGEKAKSIARQEIVKQLKARSGASAAKPSQRDTSNNKPANKADAAWDRVAKRRGIREGGLRD